MTGTPCSLRLASPEDAPGCLAIYGPVIEHSTTSFEFEVPSVDEFADRIQSTMRVWPWLVAVDAGHESDPDHGEIAGYAYAGGHRSRAAYQWNVEVSAYVTPARHRTGLGRRLYSVLFECLRAQGFINAYAGVTLPNDTSVGFHESMGFRPVGVYDDIGFKSGAWHSVGWWQLRLREDDAPTAPRPLTACRAEIEARIESHQNRV